MRKPNHYTKANMLWSTTAYCDQWNKVMAIYDKNGHLRMVVAEDPEEETYDVLMIGDDESVLVNSLGLDLGTTNKNMRTCFTLYYYFMGKYAPKFVATPENKQIIRVCDVLVHSRRGAIKNGGFKVCDDASKETTMALAALMKAKVEVS